MQVPLLHLFGNRTIININPDTRLCSLTSNANSCLASLNIPWVHAHADWLHLIDLFGNSTIININPQTSLC